MSSMIALAGEGAKRTSVFIKVDFPLDWGPVIATIWYPTPTSLMLCCLMNAFTASSLNSPSPFTTCNMPVRDMVQHGEFLKKNN